MPMYQYVKARSARAVFIKQPRLVSFLLIALGGSILVWVFWPIVSFSIFVAPLFSKVVSPIAGAASGGIKNPVGNIGASTVMSANFEGETSDTIDYTNANTWFPTKPQKKVVTAVNSYKLSIPKLGIQDSMVLIAGDNLNKSLIHYGGTTPPGEYGTAVVFGHSVLPHFFNPKNYTTIFSTLPALKVDDRILVEYDGVKYIYAVREMVITDPTDLLPLEQDFSDSHLTLITCVPPGLVTHRLNVKATLIHPQT